jgi:hypothetical protein
VCSTRFKTQIVQNGVLHTVYDTNCSKWCFAHRFHQNLNNFLLISIKKWPSNLETKSHLTIHPQTIYIHHITKIPTEIPQQNQRKFLTNFNSRQKFSPKMKFIRRSNSKHLCCMYKQARKWLIVSFPAAWILFYFFCRCVQHTIYRYQCLFMYGIKMNEKIFIRTL